MPNTSLTRLGRPHWPLTDEEHSTVLAARRMTDPASRIENASAPTEGEAAALALCYQAVLLTGQEPLDRLLNVLYGGNHPG